MSPKFIMQFKRANPCFICGKLTQRSMCEAHLEKARIAWRVRSVQRKAMGKCSYCNRKNYHGGIRCKMHVEYNAKKCSAWWFRVGKRRMELDREKGVCLNGCGKPVYLNYRHCYNHYKHRSQYMKVYRILNKG